MRLSADFLVIGVHDDFMGIADANQGARSVTNDAECVVAELLSSRQLLPSQRLLYRDTMGRWDELIQDGNAFTAFRHIGGDSFAEAIRRARSNQGARP